MKGMQMLKVILTVDLTKLTQKGYERKSSQNRIGTALSGCMTMNLFKIPS
jgi:hypothetical protein